MIDALLARVGPVLTAEGYQLQQGMIGPLPAVIAQKRLFRLRWFATQLKVTVVVVAAETMDAPQWQELLAQGFAIAKRAKGLPNGLQSGAALVAVAVVRRPDASAVAAAGAEPLREWFKGVSCNALVDAGARRVHTFDGKQLVGVVYTSFLRSQRDLVLRAIA